MPSPPVLVLFIVTLAAEALTAAAMAVSIVSPRRRIWPPPRPRAWQAGAIGLLFAIAGDGVIALGIADWGQLALRGWLRLGVGVPLWLAGNGLAVWGMVTLGLTRTMGDRGVLQRRGPYRRTRNPQYLGFMLGLLGWGLFSSSLWTLGAALAGCAPLLLAPPAEEVWLAAQHGAAYQTYRREVPRFVRLGRRKQARG